MSREAGCPLCESVAGELVWQGPDHRVILADEPDYPGFCRVIWDAHVREMSDLSADDALRLMTTVLAVERAVRRCLMPYKVNLASLGNVVPHVHWHVIPRFLDDRHYPDPVWAAPRRDSAPVAFDRAALIEGLRMELGDEQDA